MEEKNTFGILHFLDSCHREFDYVTACYLLEPWERRIVKGTLMALACVMLFAFFYFLPTCSNAVVEFITPSN